MALYTRLLGQQTLSHIIFIAARIVYAAMCSANLAVEIVNGEHFTQHSLSAMVSHFTLCAVDVGKRREVYSPQRDDDAVETLQNSKTRGAIRSERR